MPLLDVQNLVKSFGRRTVVKGVSFTVNPGEVVGLLGPNGAGKTTSFRMTTGMIAPKAGKVIFAGQDVTHWPMYRRAQLGMGYLSQESSVFRRLTVEQNILAVLELIPKLRSLGRAPTRGERLELARGVMEQFGLMKVKDSQATYLSGGEKRRLEIARCLVCEPLLILLDEPFTGIDPITISDIQQIVRNLRDSGIALLITDHNVRETLRITDRSYVITDGSVEAHGSPEEIVRHPVVIQKYLGQTFVEDVAPRYGGSRPAAASPDPDAPTVRPLRPTTPATVQQALLAERIALLIDELKTERSAHAELELLTLGPPAVPLLIDALERRDVEIRRLAWQALQRFADDLSDFEPFAPEVERRAQIAALRARLIRRAG
jgi:lipopolysaccharide export system ATP-binding protein